MSSLQIGNLSCEQKIGQLLVARGYINKEDKDFIYEMLKKKSIGGIQVKYYRGCEKEIARIKEAAGYPVLICANMENGFPGSDLQIPGMLSLASKNDIELAYQVGAITAIEARACGYNTVWGPDADIVMSDSLSKVTRSLGSDPARVAELTTAILKGYTDYGMFATMKYWPGNRDVKVDDHMILGTSLLNEEELLKNDIIPYLNAMKKANLKGVMVNHVLYKNIDPKYPASLSEKLISILRNQGFDGLITTDSFAKLGILHKYKEEDCYGLAIKAGNDMVLPNYRVPFKTSYEYLLNAYKKGVFTESRLDEAVSRVLKAQASTMNPAEIKETDDKHEEIIRKIERESICVVSDGSTPVKLDKTKKRLFIILSENNYNIEENEKEITDTCRIDDGNIEAIRDCVIKRFPDSVMVINQFPSTTQIERVCYKSTLVDEVVFITYCATGSYKGSESLTEKIINLMKSMEHKIAAVVHLGNPYAMEEIPHVPRIVMTFGGGVSSVEYSLAILKGEMEAKGKLPLKLKLK